MEWIMFQSGEWWALQREDIDIAHVHVGATHSCYVVGGTTHPDAKFPTLAEAKAWCEAMCALRGKT